LKKLNMGATCGPFASDVSAPATGPPRNDALAEAEILFEDFVSSSGPIDPTCLPPDVTATILLFLDFESIYSSREVSPSWDAGFQRSWRIIPSRLRDHLRQKQDSTEPGLQDDFLDEVGPFFDLKPRCLKSSNANEPHPSDLAPKRPGPAGGGSTGPDRPPAETGRKIRLTATARPGPSRIVANAKSLLSVPGPGARSGRLGSAPQPGVETETSEQKERVKRDVLHPPEWYPPALRPPTRQVSGVSTTSGTSISTTSFEDRVFVSCGLPHCPIHGRSRDESDDEQKFAGGFGDEAMGSGLLFVGKVYCPPNAEGANVNEYIGNWYSPQNCADTLAMPFARSAFGHGLEDKDHATSLNNWQTEPPNSPRTVSLVYDGWDPITEYPGDAFRAGPPRFDYRYSYLLKEKGWDQRRYRANSYKAFVFYYSAYSVESLAFAMNRAGEAQQIRSDKLRTEPPAFDLAAMIVVELVGRIPKANAKKWKHHPVAARAGRGFAKILDCPFVQVNTDKTDSGIKVFIAIRQEYIRMNRFSRLLPQPLGSRLPDLGNLGTSAYSHDRVFRSSPFVTLPLSRGRTQDTGKK